MAGRLFSLVMAITLLNLAIWSTKFQPMPSSEPLLGFTAYVVAKIVFNDLSFTCNFGLSETK